MKSGEQISAAIKMLAQSHPDLKKFRIFQINNATTYITGQMKNVRQQPWAIIYMRRAGASPN